MSTRRAFLLQSGGAALLTIFAARASNAAGASFTVTHSDDEWRKLLTPAQYTVLRKSGTERPFTSPLLNEHRRETSPAPAAALTCSPRPPSSKAAPAGRASGRRSKMRSATEDDSSLGMSRTAVHCRRCGGHLGHVFDDGPQPTGLRYCMNGVALTFKPLAA